MENSTQDYDLENLYSLLQRDFVNVSLPGISLSSKAYIVSQVYNHLKTQGQEKHIVFITTDMKTSRTYLEDLSFFCGKNEVTIFPHLSAKRQDAFSSEMDAIIDRNRIFERSQREKFITIAPVISLLQKTIPVNKFLEYSFKLEKGDDYKRETLVERLITLGYTRSPITQNVGEFSFRGSIFDIFSPCLEHPVRIEFLGDEIETLRHYDPETQMSLEIKKPKKIRIIPVREIVFSEENIRTGKANFKNYGDTHGIAKADRDRFLHEIENKIYFPGIDYLLSFFENSLASPLSYFPKDTLFFIDDSLALEDRGEKYKNDEQLRLSEAAEEDAFCSTYASSNMVFDEIQAFTKNSIYFDTLEVDGTHRDKIKYDISSNSDIVRDMINARLNPAYMLDPLIDRIKKWEKHGYSLNFVSRSRTQGERLKALLEDREIACTIDEKGTYTKKEKLKIYIGKLSAGFKFYREKLVFITDEEIFGERKHVDIKKSKQKEDAFLTSFSELRLNDFVVHVDHGIGIYRGLTRMGEGEQETDFITLEYKDGDKLYIPVYRLNVIQKHTGGTLTSIDKLGGTKWLTLKKKVKASLYDMADELLKIFATREKKEGFLYAPPDNLYKEFEATFPFEETEDQLSAIEDIISDMTSSKVTDRLVCGDVGYGKTEVAIRAAFIAVSSSKQVAVLVPTTLLADQHFKTFQKRLNGFSINVEMLSRFRTKAQINDVLEDLKNGKVDIIIGTHRLLSEDVKFKNMGLLIIDEEQRFGVKHKEKLKDLKKLADVITLTATPIPRTLHLSLMGIRDISIINTPPVDRLAIRTYIYKFNERLIQEAVMREVRRGGQVFFLHNRVQTINTMAFRLKEIMPDVRIGVAHGQMREQALEKIMFDFVDKKYDVLVTSTIIENGIDISSANTMIVNRADSFGLAQLYQLRGRVGRSRERAYCYLLIPDDKKITEDAKKRLQVIKGHTNLGAGFNIASHDLEIRGGGNILGKEQSGHIEEIGFDLYMKLLQETIAELKGEETKNKIDPEINLNIPAYIPNSYIDNVSLKLLTYKRIASATSENELDKLEGELRDRFGPPPTETLNLFWIMAIKINLSILNITNIKSGNMKFVLTFDKENPDISPEALVYLMTTLPNKYSITPDYKLIINLHKSEPLAILHEIRNLIERLKK